MNNNGSGVYFTIVLSIVVIYLDHCCAVIYERHIIHVPLFIHVIHHHHRQAKGQKLQKIPNFRPLPALPSSQQQHHNQQYQPNQQQHHNQQYQQNQHQPQNQQLQQQLNHPQQHFNQNPQSFAQFVNPRHPQQLLPQPQQYKEAARPQSDAQWIPPTQIQQMLRPSANQQRPDGARRPSAPGGSRPTKLKRRPPERLQQNGAPPRPVRPPSYYSTRYNHHAGQYRVPSPVKYVTRHRAVPVNDLSSNWYAYG